MENISPSVLVSLFLITFLCCGQIYDRPTAKVTVGPTTIPVGGSVSLSCSVGLSGWKYRWSRKTSVHSIIINDKNGDITVTQGGIYRCEGERVIFPTLSYPSPNINIEITFSNKVFVTRQPNRPQMFSGETITLTCEVQGGETIEWTCEWKRDGTKIHSTNSKDWTFIVYESSSGDYMCQCRRRDDRFSSTRWSETISLSVSVSKKSFVTQRPNYPQMFSGETITLTCEVNGGETTEWTCEWKRSGSKIHKTNGKDWTFIVSESSSGDYMCQCRNRDDSFPSTRWSETISLSVSADKPRAKLTEGSTKIPVGGSVTLSCSVEPPAGWKYRWFRKTKNTAEDQLIDKESREITVGQGGIYRCEGERGNPAFYSQPSLDVTIEIMFSNKVFVTRRPNWPQMFIGETVILTCEVHGGETTEWTCEWKRSGSIIHRTNGKDWTFRLSESSSGDYMCQCRRRDDWFSSTQWSEAISLPVSVTVSSSSHSYLPIVGPVVVFILLVLLVLLYFWIRYMGLFCSRCKDSESSRSDGVNQTGGREDGSPPQDVTATHAEINHQAKANRKNKERRSPAAIDKTVYSGIRSGAGDVDSAM